MADTKERVQQNIAEAFEFARFVIKHPKLLGKMRNGGEVRFVPASSHRSARASRVAEKVQAFSIETVFHRL